MEAGGGLKRPEEAEGGSRRLGDALEAKNMVNNGAAMKG